MNTTGTSACCLWFSDGANTFIVLKVTFDAFESVFFPLSPPPMPGVVLVDTYQSFDLSIDETRPRFWLTSDFPCAL